MYGHRVSSISIIIFLLLFLLATIFLFSYHFIYNYTFLLCIFSLKRLFTIIQYKMGNTLVVLRVSIYTSLYFNVLPFSLNAPGLYKNDEMVYSKNACGNCESVPTKYFAKCINLVRNV